MGGHDVQEFSGVQSWLKHKTKSSHIPKTTFMHAALSECRSCYFSYFDFFVSLQPFYALTIAVWNSYTFENNFGMNLKFKRMFNRELRVRF